MKRKMKEYDELKKDLEKTTDEYTDNFKNQKC